MKKIINEINVAVFPILFDLKMWLIDPYRPEVCRETLLAGKFQGKKEKKQEDISKN